MGAIVWNLIKAGMIATFCVTGMALAGEAPADLGGRWSSETKKLTLDVSRCGEGWCGVEVADDAHCGRTVLRLDAGEQSKGFDGTLQLAPESEAYGVRTVLRRRGDVSTLIITGQTGGRFRLARRTFDFRAEFIRIDNPACQPDARVSPRSS